MNLHRHDFLKIIEANHGIIRSLCSVYYASVEDREDVFQDIVLQLWKSFETFRGEAKISTWIYRVSLNTILAKVRDERKKVITEPIGYTELLFVHAKADGDQEMLSLILQSLRGIDKAIVILYLEGYKSKEISQILDITLTNVTTRLSRIKSELKTKFRNQHYEFR